MIKTIIFTVALIAVVTSQLFKVVESQVKNYQTKQFSTIEAVMNGGK